MAPSRRSEVRLPLGWRRFACAWRRVVYGTWPRCVAVFGTRALVLLLMHEFAFLNAFVCLVWSCWRLVSFCCVLCFVRLTAAAYLRLLFVAGSLSLSAPSAAVSRCAVAWSCHCACYGCFGLLRCAVAGNFYASAADVGALCLAASVFTLRFLVAGVVAFRNG